MKKRLMTFGFVLLLAAPAFGATATTKTAEKMDNFLNHCLNPAELSSAQVVGVCTATESSFVVFFHRYQTHPCVASTPEVCKQICDAPGPQPRGAHSRETE